MTPHVCNMQHHEHPDETRAVQKCPTCGHRRTTWEFDPIDQPRPEPRLKYRANPEFAGEAQDYRNICNGIAAAMTVIGTILLVTYLITGQWWPFR